jgi:phage FluMu protein Com
MTALAERKVTPVQKVTGWQKCSLCLYGNNFFIEIKHDKENDVYYLAEVCPKCKHVEEFKQVTKREASRYLVLDDLL